MSCMRLKNEREVSKFMFNLYLEVEIVNGMLFRYRNNVGGVNFAHAANNRVLRSELVFK